MTLVPGDPLAHRALESLLRAESAVRRRLASDLEREGLSATGFSALVVLTTAGGELELRALRPRAIVLSGRRASLDALGRLVYAARASEQLVDVFDYRGALPDTGASTVARLGAAPVQARDQLLERLNADTTGLTSSTRRAGSNGS